MVRRGLILLTIIISLLIQLSQSQDGWIFMNDNNLNSNNGDSLTNRLIRVKREWIYPPIGKQENDIYNPAILTVAVKGDSGSEDDAQYYTYSLLDPTDQDPPSQQNKYPVNNYFMIDNSRSNGQKGAVVKVIPTLKNAGSPDGSWDGSLDREEVSKWFFRVKCIEQRGDVTQTTTLIELTVFDDNDNVPYILNPEPKVSEGVKVGEVAFVLKYFDDDEPNNKNSAISKASKDLRDENGVKLYEDPPMYVDGNEVQRFSVASDNSGVVTLNYPLDFEDLNQQQINFKLTVTDGGGRPGTSTVTVHVVDVNDNAPQFVFEKGTDQYVKDVPENHPNGTAVIFMQATDLDSGTNKAAYFDLVGSSTFFNTESKPSETGNSFGSVMLISPLDYETGEKQYQFNVITYNKVGGVKDSDHQSKTTVLLRIYDVNEAPMFEPMPPIELTENVPKVNEEVVVVIAIDLDFDQNQTVTYQIIDDPLQWFTISSRDKKGYITVAQNIDREQLDQSRDNWKKLNPNDRATEYVITVQATDDYPGKIGTDGPASSSQQITFIINDQDDNKPGIGYPGDSDGDGEPDVTVCANGRPPPETWTITQNEDDPPFYVTTLVAMDNDTFASSPAPFTMTFSHVVESSIDTWNIIPVSNTPENTEFYLVHESDGGTITPGQHKIAILVSNGDAQIDHNTVILTIDVCDCSGEPVNCNVIGTVASAGFPIFVIIIIILLLLTLIIILAVVVYKRKKAAEDVKGGLLYEDEDDVRENLQVYHDEGGGEEDQDAYDISALQQPLEEPRGPRVIDMKPVTTAQPQPRLPRNIPGDDIEKYIDDAKAQADKDPTAPPFDSLLVFDYEGTGSDAGSLSSLNSGTTDGSQDYDHLNDWGPRFQKLADMYGAGSDTEE